MTKHLVAAALLVAAASTISPASTLVKEGGLFAPRTDVGFFAQCALADGTSLWLAYENVQDPVYELRLEHRSASWQLLSTLPIAVGIFYDYAGVACDASGEAIVSWNEGGSCARYRLVSADRRHAGDVREALPDSGCMSSPRFALWNDGYAMTWSTRRDEYLSDAWVQAFDRQGAPLYAPVLLTTPDDLWRGRPVAGADREGNVLVSWEQQAGDERAIVAVAVTRDGLTTGDAIEIERGGYDVVDNGPDSILSTDVGSFAVYWSPPIADGVVGQRVRILEIAPQPTTTTTTTSTTLEDDDTPVFGEDRGWARTESSRAIAPRLVTNGKGSWLASWPVGDPDRDRAATTSADGGRTWTKPSWLGESLDVAADLDGEWLAGSARNFRDWDTYGQWHEIHLFRSREGGSAWLDSQIVARIDDPWDDDCWTYAYDMKIARSRSGTLAIVWSETTSCDNSNAETTTGHAYSIRSLDDGRTWSSPILLWAKSSEGYDNSSAYAGVEVAAVGSDGFFVALANQWLSLRSTDGGATWSEPADHKAPPEVRCDRNDHCLAVSDGGTWISDDGAVTWNVPIANSFDGPPAIATNDDGIWTAVWPSRRNLGGKSGPDVDLLEASSSDGGRTWGAPRVLNGGARSDGWLRDIAPVLAYGAGSWVTVWGRQSPQDSSYPANRWEARVAVAFERCGDGTIEDFERCDDGNRTSGDGCDENCLPTGCGSGVVTAGEACDDGNDRDDDDCLPDCSRTFCGDGHVRESSERCDDGNTDDADSCTNVCVPARCGDGIVAKGVEECDDANTSNEDGCPTTCRLARCGDGFVLDGVEECDDMNFDRTDSCTVDCRAARCGDGYVWTDVEPCDVASSPDCPAGCSWWTCGDVDGDGEYTVTDSTSILYDAVGKPTNCTMQSCDVDGNLWISSRDALLSLGLSVGLDYPIRCDDGPWLTIRLQDQRRLGALQVEVDLSRAPVAVLSHRNGEAACRGLKLDEFVAGHVDGNRLTVGMITSSFFQGPMDVVACRVTTAGDAHPDQFGVTIMDATTPAGDPVWSPGVVVRVTGD